VSLHRFTDLESALTQRVEDRIGHTTTVAVMASILRGNGRYRCRWIRRRP
jgi:hypothetical protein